MTDSLDMTETLSDGSPRYRTLKNGATFDAAIHRIVRGAPLSADAARLMAARRVSLAREATQQGIAAGLKLDLKKAGSGEEWREMTRIFTERFRESKNVRGMAEAYNALGKASGYIGPEPDQAANALMLQFARMVGQLLEEDVIDADVS